MKYIIANLKMFMTKEQTIKWAEAIKQIKSKNQIMVCPSLVFIDELYQLFKGTNILVGSQDCSSEEKGALTGQVSAEQLKSEGANFVLLNHSEAKTYLYQSVFDVNKKVKQATKSGLTCVVCLPNFEKSEDLEELLGEIFGGAKLGDIILAFEPEDAIGSGKNYEAGVVNEKIGQIKGAYKKLFGQDVKVVYGGSVNYQTAREYMNAKNIDGLLIGSGATDSSKFAQICLTI